MKCTDLTVSFADKTKKAKHLHNPNGIDRHKLDALLQQLDEMIYIGCDIDASDEALGLEAEFSTGHAAFFGWCDHLIDEIWYYNNGSEDLEPVDLIINGCPQARLLRRAPEEIAAIITHFCETGERWPGCNWICDDAI